MRQLVLTGEVLGVVLLLVIMVAITQVARRSAISRGGPMVLMAVRSPSGWRTGMARVSAVDISWYSLFGIHTRPAQFWPRGQLEVGPPQETTRRPSAMVQPVQVAFVLDGRLVEVVVNRNDYTTLRSWSESAPPGRGVNVA